MKTTQDVSTMLKDLFGEAIQEIMEAELDTTLGYGKNDTSSKTGENRRNGHSKKSIVSEFGDTQILVPLDRNGEHETAKFGLVVLNELKNRGVENILICCVDNLSGFSEAIGTCFPETQIQKCIVHQIRPYAMSLIRM